MTTDTPITDHESFFVCNEETEFTSREVCFADVARKLERDLAAATKRAEHYQSECAKLSDKYAGTPCAEIRFKQQIDEVTKRADEAEAALRVRTKQIGVACEKHDLIHALACGYCLRDAEADAKLRGQVIKDCQEKMAEWIVPDSGISDHSILNKLLAILDGPQTREAMRNG